MHSAGLELTKMTYTRLEDDLMRYRGDRLDLWHGDFVPENREHLFNKKVYSNGKIVLVLKLPHAKIVEKNGIHGRNQCHAFVTVSHCSALFSRGDTLGKYRRCGRRSLLLLWCLSPLLWLSAGQLEAVVLVHNRLIIFCCFLFDVLLAADC